jgi:hypothetical protein
MVPTPITSKYTLLLARLSPWRGGRATFRASVATPCAWVIIGVVLGLVLLTAR